MFSGAYVVGVGSACKVCVVGGLGGLRMVLGSFIGVLSEHCFHVRLFFTSCLHVWS